MLNKGVCLLISLVASYFSYSQTLTVKEISDIHSTIGIFLSDQEKDNATMRQSEFIICILDFDKEGKVNGIHFMEDDKNRDSTYTYLLRITPSLFNDMTFIKCKSKSVMFPIISYGQIKSATYVENVIDSYPLKLVTVESETDKIVNVSPYRYSSPFIEVNVIKAESKQIQPKLIVRN